eukprot:TRINITY_DN4340_c0_g1_i22.p1 TRINITY_DN4340_c0_g1~~TRINITY_DN4340_c0_g1_i22.p1  ORF type:complete len:266 (+),score=49.94 TRINITY_DN4340_c0_g1_i22:384-1181(+)
MSFNIGRDDHESTKFPWVHRITKVKHLILSRSADLIGLQEVLDHQLEDLKGLLPSYACVMGSVGGQVNCDQRTPLFFKKDRFKVLSAGHLSLPPASVHSGDGGAGGDYCILSKPTCTWVCFTDFHSLHPEDRLTVYNTHLDYLNKNLREEAIEIILQHISQNLQQYDKIFFLGGFDMLPTDTNMVKISHVLNNCWETTEKAKKRMVPSFHNWQVSLSCGFPTDFIFYGGECGCVGYDVVEDRERDWGRVGMLASHHRPILGYFKE